MRTRLAALAVLASTTAASGGLPPFATEPARLIPGGRVRVDGSVVASSGDARPLFPEETARSAALRAGVRAGLGPWGEIRLDADLYRWYRPEGEGTVGETGDWRVDTKLRFGPAGASVGWAGLVGVKVPVASDDQGVGTDAADIHLAVLAGGSTGRHRWDASAGLDILASPFRERSQADLLTYGFLYRVAAGERWEIGGELAGREGGDFFPSRSMLRVGARARLGDCWAYFAVGGGLASGSPDIELRAGAQFRFERGK